MPAIFLKGAGDIDAQLPSGAATLFIDEASNSKTKAANRLFKNGVLLLEQDDYDRTTLCLAATNGSFQIPRTVVTYGAKLKVARYGDRKTALSSAAGNGKSGRVAALECSDWRKRRGSVGS